MKEMWDQRYRADEYAYGTAPNVFFKTSVEKYTLGAQLLLAAEGEGRNAVFAAKKGFEVTAFDISEEGKKKALQLAETEKVSFRYEVGNFLDMDFADKSFDAAALIYAHFPPDILSIYHRRIAALIKPDGLIILEGYSKNNLPLREKNPNIGGPNKLEMLFSVDRIKKDFSEFEILELEEVETELKEGSYHNGVAKVIRFVGKKALAERAKRS